MAIHPTAIIDKSVELGKDVSIGPFCVIRGKTTIGDGTEVISAACIGGKNGIVRIGKNNKIGHAAVLGGPPQDLKYNGEDTELHIGDNNNIREFVTFNLGTPTGGGVTRIGNHGLFMAYTHVAHDCTVGNHVIMANSMGTAGHVTFEDNVRISGHCKFTQFVRIGKFAFIGGNTAVNKDILPFTIAEGNWAVMRATNKIGLERAGFTKEEVENIHRAVRTIIMGKNTVDEAVQKIKTEIKSSPHIEYMLNFIAKSEKGLAR